LRSGDLGYQSNTQAGLLKVCYNSLQNYVETLREGICTPHHDYQKIGLTDGEVWKQVNTNLLQSEAEFYSTLRAKRVPGSGENFLKCLLDGGVEYIEVRLLDINPYLPLGIDAEEINFLDAFLLHCLLSESPEHDDDLCEAVRDNLMKTVYEGRRPELTLKDGAIERSLPEWGAQVLSDMQAVVDTLDDLHKTQAFSAAVAGQLTKLKDVACTPSAQLLEDLRTHKKSFLEFAVQKAEEHRCVLAEALDNSELSRFKRMASKSVDRQQDIKAADEIGFRQYLSDLQAEYDSLKT